MKRESLSLLQLVDFTNSRKTRLKCGTALHALVVQIGLVRVSVDFIVTTAFALLGYMKVQTIMMHHDYGCCPWTKNRQRLNIIAAYCLHIIATHCLQHHSSAQPSEQFFDTLRSITISRLQKTHYSAQSLQSQGPLKRLLCARGLFGTRRRFSGTEQTFAPPPPPPPV